MRKMLFAMALVLVSPVLDASADQLIIPKERAAQHTRINGTYAGTFLCEAGEMGMSLSLNAGHSLEQQCRSGHGDCSDHKNGQYQLTGVVNFFPTIGNPGAASGAFEVDGSVLFLGDTLTRIELEPGDWLDQPEGFGTSGLSALIYKGKISGKPTAEGCHTLHMNKIRTAN